MRDLAVKRPEGTLSFWEMYATRALEERLPDVGFEATEVRTARDCPGRTGSGGTPRDVGRAAGSVARIGRSPVGRRLVEFGGEPFFKGRGVAHLHHWLMRELRSAPLPYALAIVRGGKPVTLDARLQLGPYATPPSAAGNR